MKKIASCVLIFFLLTTYCSATTLDVTSNPLAIADNTFYAIRADGELVAWGDSFHGATGKVDDIPSYSEANHLISNAMFADGSMKLGVAIDNKQTLWAWGMDGQGRLLGNKNEIMIPTRLLDDVVEVRPGLDYCIALKKDGSVWGWGSNANGQLGVFTNEPTDKISYITAPIHILDNVKTIATDHLQGSFAIKEDGSLWAWGQQNIQDGPVWDSPKEIMKNVQAVSLSSNENNHVILNVIGNDGNLWRSFFDIAKESYSKPEMVLEQPVRIISDFCAITTENELWVWGPLVSKLTYQTETNIPVQIMTDTAFAVATVNSLMAICTDGSLFMYNHQNYQYLSDAEGPPYKPLKIGDGLLIPNLTDVILSDGSVPAVISTEQESVPIGTNHNAEKDIQMPENLSISALDYWEISIIGILMLAFLIYRFFRK